MLPEGWGCICYVSCWVSRIVSNMWWMLTEYLWTEEWMIKWSKEFSKGARVATDESFGLLLVQKVGGWELWGGGLLRKNPVLLPSEEAGSLFRLSFWETREKTEAWYWIQRCYWHWSETCVCQHSAWKSQERKMGVTNTPSIHPSLLHLLGMNFFFSFYFLIYIFHLFLFVGG